MSRGDVNNRVADLLNEQRVQCLGSYLFIPGQWVLFFLFFPIVRTRMSTFNVADNVRIEKNTERLRCRFEVPEILYLEDNDVRQVILNSARYWLDNERRERSLGSQGRRAIRTLHVHTRLSKDYYIF